MSTTDPYLLVLYYSRNGSTRELAHQCTRCRQNGSLEVGFAPYRRCLLKPHRLHPRYQQEGDVYCTQEDLAGCAGLLIDSNPLWQYGRPTEIFSRPNRWPLGQGYDGR